MACVSICEAWGVSSPLVPFKPVTALTIPLITPLGMGVGLLEPSCQRGAVRLDPATVYPKTSRTGGRRALYSRGVTLPRQLLARPIIIAKVDQDKFKLLGSHTPPGMPMSIPVTVTSAPDASG